MSQPSASPSCAVSCVVLQSLPGGGATAEISAVRMATMLMDVESIRCGLEALTDQHTEQADHPARQAILGGAMPVGSVEFVQAAMRVLQVDLPEWNCYPSELTMHLHRKVWRSTAAEARMAFSQLGHQVFVKPVGIKRFTGFVYAGGDTAAADNENLLALGALADDEPLWMSEPVSWLNEYRYYVAPGADGRQQIIGRGRYDQDGEDSASPPDEQVVAACVAALPLPHPYALDMGVLSTGQTALVEVNDAWSIGLYERALLPREYFAFLASRWSTILETIGAQ